MFAEKLKRIPRPQNDSNTLTNQLTSVRSPFMYPFQPIPAKFPNVGPNTHPAFYNGSSATNSTILSQSRQGGIGDANPGESYIPPSANSLCAQQPNDLRSHSSMAFRGFPGFPCFTGGNFLTGVASTGLPLSSSLEALTKDSRFSNFMRDLSIMAQNRSKQNFANLFKFTSAPPTNITNISKEN